MAGIVAHFREFQGGANESSTRGAMARAGAENRVNSLVNAVWSDWMDIMRRAGQDPYLADPSSMNLSPLRQLVVRLIQGRQGRLNNQQQHAIHNFFARAEEANVWYNNINGVIGAVNRESFGWQ